MQDLVTKTLSWNIWPCGFDRTHPRRTWTQPRIPSATMHNFFIVPTLSQQSRFVWLWVGGRERYFSQTLRVYLLIPVKKFTSMRKVLGDLATSQTCSVYRSPFPQPHGGRAIPGNVWVGLFLCVCVFACVWLRGCQNVIGMKLLVSFRYETSYNLQWEDARFQRFCS